MREVNTKNREKPMILTKLLLPFKQRVIKGRERNLRLYVNCSSRHRRHKLLIAKKPKKRPDDIYRKNTHEPILP